MLRIRRAIGDPGPISRFWPSLASLDSLEAMLFSHHTLSRDCITFLRLHAINISSGTNISTDILKHRNLETFLI